MTKTLMDELLSQDGVPKPHGRDRGKNGVERVTWSHPSGRHYVVVVATHADNISIRAYRDTKIMFRKTVRPVSENKKKKREALSAAVKAAEFVVEQIKLL